MWAGQINLQTSNHLVAVEYDSERTRDVLRTRCARWLSDDERKIPAAFGVRVAKVGFRRRSVGVLHHGAPIRARLGSLGQAVDVIVDFIREVEQLELLVRSRPGQVVIDARAFVRDGDMILLHAPLTLDIDERLLDELGIEEVQTWRPLIDPETGMVTIGERSWPLCGVVVVGHGEMELDDSRRHVWGLATPPESAWANRIDALGARIWTTVLAVPDALDRALN